MGSRNRRNPYVIPNHNAECIVEQVGSADEGARSLAVLHVRYIHCDASPVSGGRTMWNRSRGARLRVMAAATWVRR